MLIPFATIFTSGPQEQAITNRRLACFPRLRGSLAQSLQTADPEPARLDDICLRPAGRTEETRRLN